MDDHELATRMAAEMSTTGPITLVISPLHLFSLAGMLQLALRHPGPSPPIQSCAVWFIAMADMHFQHCPAIREVLRRGNDAAEDR